MLTVAPSHRPTHGHASGFAPGGPAPRPAPGQTARPSAGSQPVLRAFTIAAFLLLTACSRPLTQGETALLAPIHGATLDTASIRVTANPFIGLFPITYDARPRVTCRERLSPPRTGRITTSTAGFVLFERLMLAPRVMRPDFDGAPLDLAGAMFFVHEMTHVWQWQNRARTGYHPTRALREQVAVDDPYLFDDAADVPFLSYGFEAQASLVEEYLCCATLDPDGARTERLFDLLSPVLPVARPEAFDRAVLLPWEGAETRDICA